MTLTWGAQMPPVSFLLIPCRQQCQAAAVSTSLSNELTFCPGSFWLLASFRVQLSPHPNSPPDSQNCPPAPSPQTQSSGMKVWLEKDSKNCSE